MKSRSSSAGPGYLVFGSLLLGGILFLGHTRLRTETTAIQLAPVDNKIEGGVLHVATGKAVVFPTNDATVVYDSPTIITYDLAGNQIHRIDFLEPVAGAAHVRLAPSLDILSTVASRSFEKPRIYFATESFYGVTTTSFLRVIGDDALSSERFPFVERTRSAVSPAGNYFVTYGDPATGPVEMGVARGHAVGTFAVYDRGGKLVLQKGTEADPYFFLLIHDRGGVVAAHKTASAPHSRLVVLRLDGTTQWEEPVEAVRMDVISLDFTVDGDYLIEQMQAHDPDRFDARLEILSVAGKPAFQSAYPHPRRVRVCGGGLVLAAELRNRAGNRFTLIDPRQGAALADFIVAGAVEEVRPRISPDHKRLYLAVYFLDPAGELRVRLEARDLIGQMLSERELGLATLSPISLMFSDYGNGVHWLVPSEDALWLLKP
jgi:hypothetical protein